jgi:hypothetical protein
MDTASEPAPADNDEYVVQLLSTAGKRLFWRLNGPLEGAIEVAPSEYYDPGAIMEPYFGHDGAPHPVSQASLLEPPISSVTVNIQCIESWELGWSDLHWHCRDANPSDEYPRREGPRPDDETFEPNIYLLECCGQKRPWSYDKQLQVTAQGDFLTVHEFVSAVHPWLMAMRDTILEALRYINGTAPPEAELTVLRFGCGPVRIGHEDKWAWWHKRPLPPVVHSETSQVSPEERERRTRKNVMAIQAKVAALLRAGEWREAARVAERGGKW